MDDKYSKDILDVCNSILSEIKLLTSETKAAALIRFQTEFLSTEQQQRIYEAIDGTKDSHEIAVATGSSLRYVQLLLKTLTEKDLIDTEKKSHSNIPSKAIGKIATYYAKFDIQSAGGIRDE